MLTPVSNNGLVSIQPNLFSTLQMAIGFGSIPLLANKPLWCRRDAYTTRNDIFVKVGCAIALGGQRLTNPYDALLLTQVATIAVLK
ncbi:MAG: hypothetical protein LDL41_21945 [Coleofasciculus sp. S288]|nr:hypothetical protein [Coleofasciculus sp. S288]